MIMLELDKIVQNIVILTILQSIVYYMPNLSNYNDDIRFNFYRSIMCLVFTCMGLNILINHFNIGIFHPFSYKHNDMTEMLHLFFAYLLMDLIQLIANKNTRIDLYVHHIIFIGCLSCSIFTNKFGYISCIGYICEMLSIVSGVDMIAMEDNDMKTSYYCKKIRKNIIKYIRIPIWISMFIFAIRFFKKIDTTIKVQGIVIPLVMIYLDKYWENKCDKVIRAYEVNAV